MTLLIAIIDGVIGFIRRNPILCLIILLLAFFAPSVLGGIAMFILYALLGLALLVVLLVLSFRWRIGRMRKEMEEQLGAEGFKRGGFDPGASADPTHEGEVKVHKVRGVGEKRVSKDVGDYVDFEEVTEEDEK